MLATYNAVWGPFLVFMSVWWLNDAMQAVPVMFTLGYLPLLELVARLTFSLLVKIVNVGRCGSHQPLSQLQCEAPEKQKATHSTSKTTPKLLSLQTPHVNSLLYIICIIPLTKECWSFGTSWNRLFTCKKPPASCAFEHCTFIFKV